MRYVQLILLAVLLSWQGAPVSRADDLQRLLTDLWVNNSQAREQVDRWIDSDHPDPSGALDYAEVLVLVKQRRYKDAFSRSAVVLSQVPDHARLRQLRIWLSLMLGERKVTMVELSDLAAEWKSLPPDGNPKTLDLARWVGRAVGVLAGPRRRELDQPALEQSTQRLKDAMTGEEQQEFESGLAEVLQAFRDRQANLDLVQQEESANRAQQRHEQGVQLSEKLDRVDQQLADVASQARDVSAHYAEGRATIQQATPGIVGAVVESERRENWAAWQVIALQSEIRRLDELIAHEKDPERRRRWQAQRDALATQIQWDGWQLDQAVADRVGSRVALQQAQNELAHNLASEARDQDQLARHRQHLARTQVKVQRQQERLVEPDRRTSARVRSLSRASESVSTYLEFPLEEERVRLLRPGNPR